MSSSFFTTRARSTLFCRYAYEAPDTVAARSRVPKVSAFDGSNQVYCVSHSHLKRTAQLAGIMQWMGLANDMSNPNFTPPSDAEIMMAYFNKMMAKQRWQRAGAALGVLWVHCRAPEQNARPTRAARRLRRLHGATAPSGIRGDGC